LFWGQKRRSDWQLGDFPRVCDLIEISLVLAASMPALAVGWYEPPRLQLAGARVRNLLCRYAVPRVNARLANSQWEVQPNLRDGVEAIVGDLSGPIRDQGAR